MLRILQTTDLHAHALAFDYNNNNSSPVAVYRDVRSRLKTPKPQINRAYCLTQVISCKARQSQTGSLKNLRQITTRTQ